MATASHSRHGGTHAIAAFAHSDVVSGAARSGRLPVGLPWSSPTNASAASAWRSRLAGRAWQRVAAAVALLSVAAVYLGELVRILVADRAWLVQRMPDDAFYYLEIGRRIAHGQGASFDGAAATNGFHPLWQLVVAGLARLTGGDDALMRAALVTGLLVGLAGTVLVALVVRRAFGAGPALAGLVVVAHMPTALGDVADGMEGALAILGVAAVLLCLARLERTHRLRDAVLLGAACGLAVLARLDLLTVVWMVPVLAAWRMRSVRALACMAAGALVCAPYFAWNLLRFGHLLSVSGTVKQGEVAAYVDAHFGGHLSASYLQFLWEQVTQYAAMLWRAATWTAGADGIAAALLGVLLTLLCAAGAVALVTRRRALVRAAAAAAAAVALAAVLGVLAAKALVDAVFSPFWMSGWYAAAERVAAGMLAGVLLYLGVQWLGARMRPVAWTAACAAAFALVPAGVGTLGGATTTTVDGTNWQGADLQTAEWIASSGPAGHYGSPDAGVLGYFADGSHATMSNLDGLAGSYAYAQLLQSGAPALQRYRSIGLDFLVARRQSGDADVPACAVMIWHSPQGVAYDGTSVPIGVWDLRPCATG